MIPQYDWPPYLPPPQRSGRSAQVVNPKITHQLASGRTRERRLFTAVPVMHNVEWKFTRQQSAQFENWFKFTIKDGTEWFLMNLNLPQGKGPWAFRFVGIYSGPDLLGPLDGGVWVVTARLEQWLRADEVDRRQYRILEDGTYRILE